PVRRITEETGGALGLRRTPLGRRELLAVVQGVVLGGLLQGEVGAPGREGEGARPAGPHHAQGVRLALERDVQGAAGPPVAGDTDGAYTGLLVVAVGGQLTVRGQQTTEQHTLIGEADELFV